MQPPKFLYFGTTKSIYQKIINAQAILPTNDLVNLTEDEDDAWLEAKRWREPLMLKVDSQQMHNDGISFKTENGIWKTEQVDKKYLEVAY